MTRVSSRQSGIIRQVGSARVDEVRLNVGALSVDRCDYWPMMCRGLALRFAGLATAA